MQLSMEVTIPVLQYEWCVQLRHARLDDFTGVNDLGRERTFVDGISAGY